jgi:hypothetical protein
MPIQEIKTTVPLPRAEGTFYGNFNLIHAGEILSATFGRMQANF